MNLLHTSGIRAWPGIWLVGVILALLPEDGFAQSGPGSKKDFDSNQAVKMKLLSVGARARVGEKRVLGEEHPDSFRAYDLTARFQLPWAVDFQTDWVLDGHLLTSAGVLRGAGKTAVVVSAIPVLAFEWSERVIIDGGLGLAALSRHQYAQQDFGGHVQFALTAGLSAAVYRNICLGYRYQHYSDAGVYGSGTIGADFHLLELSYRY